VARDLDNDPEQMSIIALRLLSYAEAKAVYESSADDQKRRDKLVRDSELMKTVQENAFKAMKARLDHRKEHPKGGVADCRLCLSQRKR